jgi:hypothetical protein
VKDVEITLDKKRTLRFTIQALLDLQHIAGQPLGDFAHSLQRVSIEHLIWTIWVGLKHEWPKIKVEDVKPLVQTYLDDDGSLPDLMKQVNDALIESGLFTEAKADLSADPLKPAKATPA